MATSHSTIKAAVLSLQNDAKASPMTEDTYSDRMATIIQDAIQSADVTTTGTTASACTAGGSAGTCASSGGLT